MTTYSQSSKGLPSFSWRSTLKMWRPFLTVTFFSSTVVSAVGEGSRELLTLPAAGTAKGPKTGTQMACMPWKPRGGLMIPYVPTKGGGPTAGGGGQKAGLERSAPWVGDVTILGAVALLGGGEVPGEPASPNELAEAARMGCAGDPAMN